MNLVFDIGNTNTKVGVFDNDNLIEKYIFKNGSNFMDSSFLNRNYQKAIISGSGDTNIAEWKEVKASEKIYFNDIDRNLLKSQYQSIDTLGSDRWLNAYASTKIFPKMNNLIIDVGSCLTLTFINCDEVILGGSISPGIRLRNQSMHDYTHKLPFIDFPKIQSEVLGTSTDQSIWSGIFYGILFEIEARIDTYNSQFDNINAILTGGDAHFFENRIKNKIFADSNLTLKGLNYLLNTI